MIRIFVYIAKIDDTKTIWIELISVFLPRRTRETFRRLFQVKYGNGFIYFSKPEKQLYPVLNSENGLVPQQSKRLIGKKSTISLGFSVFNNVEKDGENLKKSIFSGLKSMWIIHWDDLESMWIILILSYESEDRLFRVELAGCGDVTRLWCMAVLGGAVEGKWRSGDWHCSMCVCCFLHLPQFSF